MRPDAGQERGTGDLQFCYSSLGRTQRATQGHSGEAPGSIAKQWSGVEKSGQACLLWLPQEGKDEAEQTGLGYANLNNFSRLWSTGASPGCLVPGPG